MKRFYTKHINGGQALLKDKERDHCIRVLRTVEGEQVEVVDGEGNLYIGTLSGSTKREARIHIERGPVFTERYNLPVIACAIPKNHSRWESFLEKAVEIGVASIIPLITHRSEKKHIRRERNEQIILSAFKQAGHCYLPTLEEPIHLNELLAQRKNTEEEKFVAYCGDAQKPFLGNLHKKGRKAVVLIGPEGDFTPDEVTLARKSGCIPVSLGPSRLRVETAAVVACAAIQFKEQII